MTERIVCDASAVVAVLLDSGPTGRWAADMVKGAQLFAPMLMPFECASVVRRLELDGTVSTDQAAQAHADLLDFNVELLPYEIAASRAWELRTNLSCYDAAYVALAEVLDASVITLDRRIQTASGLRCFLHTPASS